jgi:hypothetical protein
VDLPNIVRRVIAARDDAKRILALHEASAARIVVLEDTYRVLGRLSLDQDDLFRQALRAAEHGLFRSAIIMAWAGFMDYAEERLGADGFKAVNARYQAWKISDIDDLRDKINDFQVIDALYAVKLCSKGAKKSLHGLLSTRNECAHPSDFYPVLNDSLGFISQLLQRVQTMGPKIPK